MPDCTRFEIGLGSRVLKAPGYSRLQGTQGSRVPQAPGYSVVPLTCPHALGLTVQLYSVYSSVHVSS